MAGRDALETCETVRPQIAPFVAGKLTASEATVVSAHLSECDACTREAAFSRVLTTSLPRLPVPSPPPALFDQIALATYAAPPRRTLREALLSFISPAPTRLALGTAFAVSIAALVVLPRLAEQPVGTQPSLPLSASRTPNTTAPVKTVAPALSPRPKTPPTIVQNKITPAPVASTVTRSKRAAVIAKVKTPANAEVVSPLRVAVPDTSTGMQVAKATPVSPSVSTEKTVIKNPLHIAVMTSSPIKRAISHRNGQGGTAKTVIAANMIPKNAPDEDLATEDEMPTKIEPDMDRATQVATRMPDMGMPAASGEGTGSLVRGKFTLGGAGLSRASRIGKTILSSRSASDLGSGSGMLSVVQAPAKVD